jgi:hypothetical protein
VMSTIGSLLFLGSILGVCIIDWHGFTSLRGRIKWWRLTDGQRFRLVCAYLCVFEIMTPIYIVCAWIDWQRARAQAPFQRKLRTAQLEAQLGYTPATDGTCRSCAKPLQVCAEFCAYCRAPIVARPRVCPHCATTAPADAHWCPSWGNALP